MGKPGEDGNRRRLTVKGQEGKKPHIRGTARQLEASICCRVRNGPLQVHAVRLQTGDVVDDRMEGYVKGINEVRG